jgi:2-isopropylmalate synthase
VVTIYGKTSMLHVREVLRCTPEENLAMIGDTVRYLKDNGITVFYDAEHCFDGYKLDSEYAIATWQAAEKAGADLVVLCDTNGGCMPNEVAAITRIAVGRLTCKVGIHTHDDIGLGVANALAAVEAGAVHVQGTINGYGERTGNCNLTSIIPCIELKMQKTCVPAESLPGLKELSMFVDEVANMPHNPRQPWVGSAAFAHKGGTHVNAVQKLASSYEHIHPGLVGNARNVLISDLAGRSNIVMKAHELGFKLANDAPELKAILARIKELEHQGYEFESADASLALRIRQIIDKRKLPFEIESYNVTTERQGRNSVCQATVGIRAGQTASTATDTGDGPVNALDKALRRALVKSFPQLKDVSLTDYKVRILKKMEVITLVHGQAVRKLPGGVEVRQRRVQRLAIPTGTASRTRVLIQSTDGKREWGTVGVHDNIIEASLQALVDSMEFALLRK